MGWMLTGGQDEDERIEKEQKSKSGKYLKLEDDKDSAIVHYLHRKRVGVIQHVFEVEGKWITETCLNGTDEKCPFCENKIKDSFGGFYKVIDRSDNKTKIFKQPMSGVKLLNTLDQGDGTDVDPQPLTECAIKITRIGKKKDPKTTYTFNVLKKYPTTPEMLARASEIDFNKELKPKSRREALALLGGREEEEEVVNNFGDVEDSSPF